MTPKAEACWSARVPFRRSHAFARLMAGLRESLEFQAASVAGRTRFVFAVNRLLTVVENHPELVDEVLESAGMNASTIADRYRQSFDRLMLAAQLHMMGKGAGTEELVAATLMRDSYRRERVATMAAQQAREQRVDAEVALDLAYRLHLSRGAVGFPFDYDVELAEIAAHLDDAYFAELAEDIRSAETRELVDFMISSSVWRRFLIRMHYTRYLGLIDRFDVNLDPGSADGRHSDPGAASPQDLAFDMARARRDRDIRVAQREAAVRDWLQLETIALLHDNPVMHGASPEPS